MAARYSTVLFILSLQASSTQSSIGASQGPLFGARAHFRMTGKSIIRRQKNRNVDGELDRFSTGRVRKNFASKENGMESFTPTGTVLSIESFQILVGRNVRL